MAVHPGRLQFGAERGRIALLTTRDGLAATAGHDLTIELTQWSAELEVADDLAPTGLTVRADMNSLVVREGRGGVKPLTDRDRREIAVTARKLLRVDRFPAVTFTAAQFDRDADGGGTLAGTLSLAGTDRPLRLTVTRRTGPAGTGSGTGSGDGPSGAYHATAALRQTEFGHQAVHARSSARSRSVTRCGSRSTWTSRERRAGRHRERRAGRTAFERRGPAGQALVAGAGQIATAAHAMAQRFHQGGKLIVFGTGGAATDAQHVAVEFVHPVIVGKRALPAICLTCDAATITGIAARQGLDAIFSHQIRYLAEPADIAAGIWVDGPSPSVLAGLAAARERGLLTIALGGGPTARSRAGP